MKHSRARDPEAIEFARGPARHGKWIRADCLAMGSQPASLPPEVSPRISPPSYTADFCCVELKLILEVDGADHFIEAGQERDRVRDEALAREGYLVVRISGFDVLREPERVCQGIEERVRERMRELGVD